jgi:succinoglycan biosynthesis protein ExoM
MRVAICIITFCRLEGLKRLLLSLEALTLVNYPIESLEVVVVNNDLSTPIDLLLGEIKLEYKWPLQWDEEPRRGISYARNKVISCVNSNVDFIAFIDDDEVPETTWLEELLLTQIRYQADVVSGPVLPRFFQPVPDWIIKGKFFDRHRHPTGSVLQAAATNNVLIRAEILRQIEKPFDERWALSGGEDWHLFRQLSQDGYKLVWADDALVYEWVPQSRVSISWILQRGYRLGNTDSLSALDASPRFVVRLIWLLKAIHRFVVGLLFIPLSVIFGWHSFIKTLRFIFHGLGILMGILGIRYDEYRKIHGI